MNSKILSKLVFKMAGRQNDKANRLVHATITIDYTMTTHKIVMITKKRNKECTSARYKVN